MEGYDANGENTSQDRSSGTMADSIVLDGETMIHSDGAIAYQTPFSGGGFDTSLERIWW